MPSEELVKRLFGLRDCPQWKLLSADNAPIILGVLQTLLYDDRSERVLKSSTFHIRVGKEISRLRELGHDLPKSPQRYVNDWVGAGFLIRRFPHGSNEEEYELSAASIDAIRIVSSFIEQRVTLTESRLATVIQSLVRLSEDADPDSARRVERLKEDRLRLDREIERIESGQASIISKEVALERVREIIDLGQGLTEHFRRVMDQFISLHRALREKMLVFDESLGAVAEEVLDGIDKIEESEAGRSFAAFYSLLTNDEQQGLLTRSLQTIIESDFFGDLRNDEKEFLIEFVRILLVESQNIHSETTKLGYALDQLVRSRVFRERRRLLQAIKEAQKDALIVKESINLIRSLELVLDLTSLRINSVSQISLFDPAKRIPGEPILPADNAAADFDSIIRSIKTSEIDYAALRRLIAEALKIFETASIAQILELHPAEQGLGTVIGLLHLAHKFGSRDPNLARETVYWRGLDSVERQARINVWLFARETADILMADDFMNISGS
ncbi:MAG: DUF3375 domain-containing protein [Deltaproteobacteria bacterium]|jgi:hypothetical protein|nr:DUF3375 domain-containing protein [Deltaproteobacteria bacterium]